MSSTQSLPSPIAFDLGFHKFGHHRTLQSVQFFLQTLQFVPIQLDLQIVRVTTNEHSKEMQLFKRRIQYGEQLGSHGTTDRGWHVKSSIMNLCRFFKAMSLTIEAIVKHSVQPFLENIAAGSSDDDKVAKIGNYTFTDLQRTMLYHSALTIKANFSVFGDIAAMWCELSEKYIMPGVHMLDQLSLNEPDEQKRQRQIQDLQRWTDRSTEGVKLIAEHSQHQILESMERRVKAIQSVTKQLPPSAPMKQAIDAGMQESREVAVESIVAASVKNGLDRFVPKRK
jgi:hypothetical protein